MVTRWQRRITGIVRTIRWSRPLAKARSVEPDRSLGASRRRVWNAAARRNRQEKNCPPLAVIVELPVVAVLVMRALGEWREFEDRTGAGHAAR